MASCANDACVRLWRLSREGRSQCLSTTVAHAHVVYDVAVVGSLLVSCSFDRTVKVRLRVGVWVCGVWRRHWA
jgi:WD40 repeat protein